MMTPKNLINLSLSLVVLMVASSCATSVVNPSASSFSYSSASRAGEKICEPCADGGHYPVHLTFDDGPYKTLTLRALKTLSEKSPIEVTFFELTSAYSSKQSERDLSNFDDATPTQLKTILAAIHSGGHGLACHTLEHIDHADASIPLEKAKANIRRGIELAPKGSLKYLRLPYGRGWYNETDPADQERANEIMSYIKSLGYKHLGWDIDTFDAMDDYDHSQQTHVLLGNICSKRGGIVLMHDIQPIEMRTLATTIDSVRCSGHQFVDLKTMEELNRQHPKTSFQDHANYRVIDCPGGTKDIKNGKCMVQPD